MQTPSANFIIEQQMCQFAAKRKTIEQFQF